MFWVLVVLGLGFLGFRISALRGKSPGSLGVAWHTSLNPKQDCSFCHKFSGLLDLK